MAKLMTDVLGYERYGVRGSDLGGVIARQMAAVHPERVIGVHLTGIIGTAGGAPPFTDREQAFIDATQRVESELAYARLQMSKPQTRVHDLTKDLFPAAPREWGERLFNVRHWVETDRGGHFLEWEEPEHVARDLQTFFGPLR